MVRRKPAQGCSLFSLALPLVGCAATTSTLLVGFILPLWFFYHMTPSLCQISALTPLTANSHTRHKNAADDINSGPVSRFSGATNEAVTEHIATAITSATAAAAAAAAATATAAGAAAAAITSTAAAVDIDVLSARAGITAAGAGAGAGAGGVCVCAVASIILARQAFTKQLNDTYQLPDLCYRCCCRCLALRCSNEVTQRCTASLLSHCLIIHDRCFLFRVE
jgi:hypothetical protein